MNEPGVGELSFFRVYSGTVKGGTEMYNASRNVTERVGQLFILNGHNRTNVPHLHAGDIGAAVKLRDTHTGDTLCSSKLIVSLPRVTYPKPNIHGALILTNKGDDEKIAIGLATLHEEDPTFLWRVDGAGGLVSRCRIATERAVRDAGKAARSGRASRAFPQVTERPRQMGRDSVAAHRRTATGQFHRPCR